MKIFIIHLNMLQNIDKTDQRGARELKKELQQQQVASRWIKTNFEAEQQNLVSSFFKDQLQQRSSSPFPSFRVMFVVIS